MTTKPTYYGRLKVREDGRIEPEECFVATAVYGSKNAPEVQALREYRDNILSKSRFGQRFICFYYSGKGKAAANFIKKNLPSSITIIRKGLDFLVRKYQKE